MNWFTLATTKRTPLRDIYKHIPYGYELLERDDGSVSVVRPPKSDDEDETNREIKRQEKPRPDWPREDMIKQILEDAVNRIRFIES